MKKAISILAAAVLIISLVSVTAFAHGGHGNTNKTQQQPRYEVCTVAGCDAVGPHQHDGVWYCNQNGCGNYETCTVKGCAESGLHKHNGVYYRPANHGMGRGCGRR